MESTKNTEKELTFEEFEKVLMERPDIMEFMMLVKDSPELIEKSIAYLSEKSEVRVDE